MTTPITPNSHTFAPTEKLFKNILDLFKLVIPTDGSEKAEEANSLLVLAESHLKESSDAFQLLQQQVAELTGKSLSEDSHDQNKLVDDLKKKVSAVDNQLNKAKKDTYSSQIAGTKDNILVRTTKDSKAVGEYIVQTIRRHDKNRVSQTPYSRWRPSNFLTFRSTSSPPTRSPREHPSLLPDMSEIKSLKGPQAHLHPSCTKCTWALFSKISFLRG